MFKAALFTIAKKWKQPKCPSTGEWIKKMWRMFIPGAASGKEPASQCWRHKRLRVPSLGEEDPLEEGAATHSSILAWRIPWTEEPGSYSP